MNDKAGAGFPGDSAALPGALSVCLAIDVAFSENGAMATSNRSRAAKPYEIVGTTYDGVKILKPKTKATHFTAAEVKSAIANAMRELAASRRSATGGQGNVFVEPRPQGDFAVKRAHAKRASAVRDTQADAITRAKELEPDKAPLVKRVRNTKKGAAGQWRKA